MKLITFIVSVLLLSGALFVCAPQAAIVAASVLAIKMFEFCMGVYLSLYLNNLLTYIYIDGKKLIKVPGYPNFIALFLLVFY